MQNNNSDIQLSLLEFLSEVAESFRRLFKRIKAALENRLRAYLNRFEKRAELINDPFTSVHPAATRKTMQHQVMKPQVTWNKPTRISARSCC